MPPDPNVTPFKGAAPAQHRMLAAARRMPPDPKAKDARRMPPDPNVTPFRARRRRSQRRMLAAARRMPPDPNVTPFKGVARGVRQARM
jgi:hypothetical protein